MTQGLRPLVGETPYRNPPSPCHHGAEPPASGAWLMSRGCVLLGLEWGWLYKLGSNISTPMGRPHLPQSGGYCRWQLNCWLAVQGVQLALECNIVCKQFFHVHILAHLDFLPLAWLGMGGRWMREFHPRCVNSRAERGNSRAGHQYRWPEHGTAAPCWR